ncbi:SAM-dependent methyltransferase [Paenibacillus kobensis]|uniref:hypothetical protein n=1 Tax=Paenibacillus kobensis TaxID=59841 RepID=UPI001FE81A15|nr:hypothetical protein [Paenibacillus kobensis]
MLMTIMTPLMLLFFALSLVYYYAFFPREKDERTNQILRLSYSKAYYVLLFGLLVCFILGRIPTLDLHDDAFKNSILFALTASQAAMMASMVYYNRKI